MAELPLSDPLLVELVRARPGGPDRTADEPGAVAVLERIISTGPGTPSRRAKLRRQGTRRRGHLPIRRVAAVVAMAAVAVIAGLGVIGFGEHHRTAANPLAIQTVVQRTKAALAAAVTQDVEYSVTITTYSPRKPIPVRTISQWTNTTRTNIEVVNPSGAPFEDVWYSGSPGGAAGATEVLYPAHAWWTTTAAIVATQMQDITGHDIAARIQAWVNAGQLSVVGTRTVDGQETIEVLGNALTLDQAARTLPASPTSTDHFDLTMWLDPSSYLPVQLTTTYTTPTNPGSTTSTTSTVSWLPATSANLAKLQGQIPSGFTHLPGPPAIATGSLPTTPN